MFKTAAAKIAHNSTIPALGGNQDLRPLQDLIAAEKAVLISLQKLSVDYTKASEALRTWGLNEGDDLGDILSASTTLLNHFSVALSQYASHGHVMRDNLKAIRTREESLEELKRRRRTVVKKAEDADKKLSKMSPEHKNLAMQTETLNRLREEIRTMDSDIMTEEAALGDFKRTSTRNWMGLKFGGLLECCEKGTIVSDFGKMLISEIPEETTQPGLPRSLYYGHSKTENLVSEAYGRINDVTLSTVPSAGLHDRRQYDQSLPSIPQDSLHNNGEELTFGAGPWSPNESKPQPPPPVNTNHDYSKPNHQIDPPSLNAAAGSAFPNSTYNFSPPPQFSGFSQTAPLHNPNGDPGPSQTMDDFGVNTRSPAGLHDASNTSGGRFNTFPVKARPLGSTGGYSLQDPPSHSPRHDKEQSRSVVGGFSQQESSSLSPQHDRGYSLQDPPLLGPRHDQELSFSASIAEALDENLPQAPPLAAEGTSSWNGRNGTKHQWSPPPLSPGSAPLPPPPPGAALPNLSNPWANTNPNDSLQAASQPGNIPSLSNNDDALLAYMTMGSEDDFLDDEPPKAIPRLGLTVQEDEHQRLSRHVRFGDVEDVEEELEKRSSLEKERQAQVANNDDHVTLPMVPQPVGQEENQRPVTPEKTNIGTTTLSSQDSSDSMAHRVPSPPFNPEDHERALDAAAAPDLTRELEALKHNTSTPSDAAQRSQTGSPIDSGQPTGGREYSEQPNFAREPSPLLPPSAPFAGRSVSPHPYAELNTNAAAQYATQYAAQYSPTASQAPQQPYPSSPSYASPPGPAQAHTQHHQASPSGSPTTPEAHITSTSLPPRFQALSHSPVPPRFQAARSRSPGSPMASQLPPRFQTSGATQVPPTISMPEQQDPRSFATTKPAEVSTPYRTPPEFPSPRQLGASPAFTTSNSSLKASAGISPIPSAPRTISAAAFKRPRNASADALGAAGDFAKKSLPSSPYPAREPLALNTDRTGGSAPVPIPGSEASAAQPAELDDDHYDYISAYVNNSNPSTPQQDKLTLDQGRGPGQTAGGYGEGRFATDLDAGLR